MDDEGGDDVRTVLLVAAGVAVGLTAVIAVLIQVLQQLFPLLVVIAIVVIAVCLARRRRAGGGVASVTSARVDGAALRASSDHHEAYLRWETPAVEYDAGVGSLAAHGAQLRRARTSVRPPRAGRRP